MVDVLLAPHNDDEALFCAFTCLRYRPRVIVCLRSFKQGANWARRELETSAAMHVLGCAWQQWDVPDARPDWPAVRKAVRALADDPEVDRCFAPWPRWAQNGHTPTDHGIDGVHQHDVIGAIAQDVFRDRYVGYLTYTRAGKDEFGDRVPFEPEWPALKLEALLCYRSQIVRPEIVPHFLGSLTEYYAREAGP